MYVCIYIYTYIYTCRLAISSLFSMKCWIDLFSPFQTYEQDSEFLTFEMREKLHEIIQKNKKINSLSSRSQSTFKGPCLRRNRGGRGLQKMKKRKKKVGGTSMKGRGIPGPMPTIVCLQP